LPHFRPTLLYRAEVGLEASNARLFAQSLVFSRPGEKPGDGRNPGTSMISKSQQETEVSNHLEKTALEA
jgi:hypothetical protein